MKKEKMYKKIILLLAGVIITQLAHIQATNVRGYKAIGGEFLLVPLVVVMYVIGQALKERWEITNEHFKKKEEVKVWKEEGRQDYAK